MKIRNPFHRLTRFEWVLWVTSLTIVAGSFLLTEPDSWMVLSASLIGVTALIFVAKGDVFGQILTIVFSLFYAVISFQFAYYGEMITYLGMTMPIAVLSVITWMKHPFAGNAHEVQISRLGLKKSLGLFLLSLLVTAGFYFILDYFGTANLFFSTVSITTSFLASSLTLLRSPSYALAYAANDIVLIVLWILAAMENSAFLPMVICFAMFLCNDLYGFINWRRMQQRQSRQQTSFVK